MPLTLRHRRTLLNHAAVGLASVALVAAFRLDQGGARAPWNQPLGQAAVVLLAAALLMGPLARLWPRARALLGVRREVGAWAALVTIAHVVLVMEEWALWSLAPLYSRFGAGGERLVDGGLALANLAGLVALGYGAILLATSNDTAQRRLGPLWKELQRGATTFFLLAVLHTAFFLFLDRSGSTLTGDSFGHGPFRTLFLGLVLAVVMVRTAAFWSSRARNRPRPPQTL